MFRLLGALAAVIWKTVEFIFKVSIDFCNTILGAIREVLDYIVDRIAEGWCAVMIRISSPNDIPPSLLDTAYGSKIKKVIENNGVIVLPVDYNRRDGKIGEVHKVIVAEKEEKDVRNKFNEDGILVAEAAV